MIIRDIYGRVIPRILPIRYAVDPHGHEHREKGPRGGQFVPRGQAANTPGMKSGSGGLSGGSTPSSPGATTPSVSIQGMPDISNPSAPYDPDQFEPETPQNPVAPTEPETPEVPAPQPTSGNPYSPSSIIPPQWKGNLDQQTIGLLTHCYDNPDDWSTLAIAADSLADLGDPRAELVRAGAVMKRFMSDPENLNQPLPEHNSFYMGQNGFDILTLQESPVGQSLINMWNTLTVSALVKSDPKSQDPANQSVSQWNFFHSMDLCGFSELQFFHDLPNEASAMLQVPQWTDEELEENRRRWAVSASIFNKIYSLYDPKTKTLKEPTGYHRLDGRPIIPPRRTRIQSLRGTPIRYAVDPHGHEHRDKGPKGGQFVPKGQAGNTPTPKPGSDGGAGAPPPTPTPSVPTVGIEGVSVGPLHAPSMQPAASAPPIPNVTRESLTDHFMHFLSESRNLSDEQRLTYAGAVHAVLGRIPQPALQRLAENSVGGTYFYPNTRDMAVGSVDSLLRSEPNLDRATASYYKNLRTKLMTGRETMGGAYVRSAGGHLHLDGPYGENLPMPPGAFGGAAQNPEELYAHEFGHAIDGYGDHLHSESPEWESAWNAEIAKSTRVAGISRLCTYAEKSPLEGWAEFSRLVYGGRVSREIVTRMFPMCTMVFQRLGFMPGEQHGNS